MSNTQVRTFSYRPVSPAGSDVAREALQVEATRRLARALREVEQLPRLMRAAGVERVRIDADGRIVIVLTAADLTAPEEPR